MIEHTQKLMKEIQVVSDRNLILKAEIQDFEKRYHKVVDAFNDLLDLHIQMRETYGLGELTDEIKYNWVDKAGLMDLD
jgi:predicted  nucleic acid-binding Zn-ribbon protein